METRHFFRKTYCPKEDKQVTYEEGCRVCDFNEFHDGIFNKVDCSYEEGNNE